MSNKIGRYEILSEITRSETASIFKCSDPESGQTVVLKAVKLEILGEQAAAVIQHTLEEVDRSNVLNSHNVAQLYGAGDMDGQFCAAMEYVQGNSIATMLARKEGFSIWDLQDIARQTCQGLDHAHVRNVMHYSLEPAKILVTWDGTVKILGFGISTMGAYTAQIPGKPTEVLHYMSPEQLRGDPVDPRSNLFSLGAVLYEMVTERKAFAGEAAETVRQQIIEQIPPAPDQINRKIHPALVEVIMKALSKIPEERYQRGQELVNDLEKCKESASKVAAKKAAQPAKGSATQQKAKPTSAAGTTVPVRPAAVTTVASAPPKTTAAKVEDRALSETTRVEAKTVEPKTSETAPSSAPEPRSEVAAETTVTDMPVMESPRAHHKAAAAAAGWSGSGSSSTLASPKKLILDPSAEFADAQASAQGLTENDAVMSSAATVEPEAASPPIQVDPMMDESRQDAGKQGPSFSEIDELPPMKEIYIAPPPPPPVTEAAPMDPVRATVFRSAPPDKPKVQPRQMAKKAVTEIKKTPPKLILYSIASAVGIILLVVVYMAFHIRSENSDDDNTPAQSAATTAPAQPESNQTGRAGQPAVPAATPVPVQAQPAQAEPVIAEPARSVSVRAKYNSKKKGKTPPPAVIAVIPGQLTINSTPAGAAVQVDGRNDPSWATPFNLAGVAPGQYAVSVSKPGYSTESRTIDVASNSKSFLVVQLAPLTATVAVTSEPAGAAVFLDGHDTGRVTPAQVPVDKPGSHTVMVRKQGYLEETTTANLQAGQAFHFAPTLRALGATDDIKLGGKFKKIFGGGDTAGMGSVSVKTQPKGAQIAVNNRMLDKGSPVEFFLNPGTYVVDITLSGFKNIHRVVTVDKGGKVAVDETMQRE
jgi:eukaryotic-like serine/threonine-protein kinase